MSDEVLTPVHPVPPPTSIEMTSTATAALAVPTHAPPPATVAVTPRVSQALSAADQQLLPAVVRGAATPAEAVQGVARQSASVASTTWQSQKNIVDQWTINQDRYSWIGVAGMGWLKLSTASDSGCVALTMLASNALVSRASVSFRQEADGMVHEIYVF